jgi:hypothetical protein
MFEAAQVGNTSNSVPWSIPQSRQAVQEVLRRVIRRVADEGLGIDDEPRLTGGAEHVPSV